MLVAQVLLILLFTSATLVQVQASKNPKPEANQNPPKVSVGSSGSSGTDQRPPVSTQVKHEQSNNPDNLQEPFDALDLIPLAYELNFAMSFPKDILESTQAQLTLFESEVKNSSLPSTEQDLMLSHSKVNQIRDDINTVTQAGGRAMLDRLLSEYKVLDEDKYHRSQNVKCLSKAEYEKRLAILKTDSGPIIEPVKRLKTALYQLGTLDKLMQNYSGRVTELRQLFDAKDLSQPKFKKAEKKWHKVVKAQRALPMVLYKAWLNLKPGKNYIASIFFAAARLEFAMKNAKKYSGDTSMLAKVGYRVGIGSILALGATGLAYWLKPEWFGWTTGSPAPEPPEDIVTQVDLSSASFDSASAWPSSATIESTQLPSSLNSVYIAIFVVLAMVAIVTGLLYYFAVYLKNRKSGTKGKDPEAGKVAADLQSSFTPGHKSSKNKRSSKQGPLEFSRGNKDSTDTSTTTDTSGKNRS